MYSIRQLDSSTPVPEKVYSFWLELAKLSDEQAERRDTFFNEVNERIRNISVDPKGIETK